MYKVHQVAERLNCSISTVYQLIESGRLEHHRCPGIRISDEQLHDYLEHTRQRGEAASRQRFAAPRPRLKHITL
jgi:excisionase family DNA binding protein